MKKRFIMAGKREGFDWEDEGRIVFTRNPEIEISLLAKDGYREFYVLEQTMKKTIDATEHSLTEKEERMQNTLNEVEDALKRILYSSGSSISIGEVFKAYAVLRDMNTEK